MSKKTGLNGLRINPRPYQIEAMRAVWLAWHKRHRRTVMIVMAGGCGKTIVFSMISNHFVKNKNNNILIIAHRGELLSQAADKLFKSTGIQASVEKAELTAVGSNANVVVASVQTLSNKKRLTQYTKDHFDYIIIDEGHRSLARSYLKIVDYFDAAKLLAVTATPMRGDGQKMTQLYEEIAYKYPLYTAVDDGWLSPIVIMTCPLGINLDAGIKAHENERKAEGAKHERALSLDPSERAVGYAIEPYLNQIAAEIKKHASDRKTLIFLPLIATSKKMMKALNDIGIESRHVDGSLNAKKRAENENWFRNAPNGTAMCNAMLWTEGYDQADISNVVMLRATKSTGLYIQAMVRGTRVLDQSINNPGLTADQRKKIIANSDKPNMQIMDFLMLSDIHNLCRPSCLVAKTPEIAAKMNEILYGPVGRSLKDVEKEAHTSLVLEREERLVQNLRGFMGNKSRKFDPVLQAVSMFDDTLVNWTPETKSEAEPITKSQEKLLKDHGFDCSGWKKGYAQKIIAAMDQRRKDGLGTAKMARCLRQNGYGDAALKMSYDDAHAAMGKLSAKWKRQKEYRNRR